LALRKAFLAAAASFSAAVNSLCEGSFTLCSLACEAILADLTFSFAAVFFILAVVRLALAFFTLAPVFAATFLALTADFFTIFLNLLEVLFFFF